MSSVISKSRAEIYNYKYNGKELQETGMVAMDFRHYMPDIGRFSGMDALTESFPNQTPYQFANNNSIFYKDPTGLYGVDADGNITINNADEISSFMSFLNHNSGASTAEMVKYIANPDNGFSQDLEGVNIIVHRGGGYDAAAQSIIQYEEVQSANNFTSFHGNVSILGHNLNNFDKGIIGAEKSNFASGSAWAGYAGLNLEKYNFILKTTFREEQSFSSLKYVAKTIKNVEIAGKTLGYIGVGLSIYEDATNNKLGWGTVAKAGIGLACIYLGPVGVAYSIIDLSVGAATGTTLTDRIAEGIDEESK